MRQGQGLLLKGQELENPDKELKDLLEKLEEVLDNGCNVEVC